MTKNEIIKFLNDVNPNLRLPKYIDFRIESNTLFLQLPSKGLTSNMQTNEAAFEGWAICLKAWIPTINKVHIDCKSKNLPKANEHYHRFLYRLMKFINIYSWADTTEDFKAEIKQLANINLVVNVPRGNAKQEASHQEAQLEREFCKREKARFDAINHQLPVRFFKREVPCQESFTPNSFLDIWSIEGNTLNIYELKLPTNKQVGIISELMFYVNVMADIMTHKIDIPSTSSSRSFDKLYSMYNDKCCNHINGIFLADAMHSMFEEKEEEILSIINKGEFPISIQYSHQFVHEYVMKRTFYKQEKRHQIAFYNKHLSKIARNMGFFKGEHEFVLQSIDSKYNLFEGIRDAAISYFNNHKITWWGENKKHKSPTGHLVSSQIHCLNHLFAIRNDEKAVKAILENVIGIEIDEILVSPLDNEGYITFEFVHKNKALLGEKHETRGTKCTSIDALVYARRKDGKKMLFPIEWKYTESYDGKEANIESLKRYPERILPTSNIKKWNDIYKVDPYYELMRQTLLVERIIAMPELANIEAHDYMHILVVPNSHTEFRSAIIGAYLPTLKEQSKFRIIDPQALLSPIPADGDYKDLISYLQTRYWKK